MKAAARHSRQYHDRVNRVLDYIAEHIDADLSLARLARVACFSRFHFHRIFQGITGETVNDRVLKTSPRKRITDLALETGFAGTAEFSRAFENKAPGTLSYHTIEELRSWVAGARAKVRVQACGAFRFVCSRIYQPYGNAGLVERYQALIQWLARRGTNVRDVIVAGMSIDDPSITPAENCRYYRGGVPARVAEPCNWGRTPAGRNATLRA